LNQADSIIYRAVRHDRVRGYTYSASANLRRHALTIFVFRLCCTIWLLRTLAFLQSSLAVFRCAIKPSFQTSMSIDNSQASKTFQLALLPFLYLLLGIPHCIFEENIVQEGCAVPNIGGILFEVFSVFVLFLLI
jgi:hypothetical protein